MNASARADRFDVRTTREEKRLLKRAADLLGRSLSDFILGSAHEAAQRTIEEHTILRLTERDREVLIGALLNPPEPNARFVKAAEHHRRVTR